MTRSVSRRTLSLAATLSAFGALAAAPAQADCSAGPIRMSTSAGPSYTCTRNCAVTGGGRVIRTATFGPSATVSQCLAECTRTLGCTQVSYTTSVEMRDGVPIVRMTCTLMGSGDPGTADVPPAVGRSAGVCTRDPALYQHHDIQIDTRVRQDSFRPNLPIQLPGPTSPN